MTMSSSVSSLATSSAASTRHPCRLLASIAKSRPFDASSRLSVVLCIASLLSCIWQLEAWVLFRTLSASRAEVAVRLSSGALALRTTLQPRCFPCPSCCGLRVRFRCSVRRGAMFTAFCSLPELLLVAEWPPVRACEASSATSASRLSQKWQRAFSLSTRSLVWSCMSTSAFHASKFCVFTFTAAGPPNGDELDQ